MRKNTEQPTEIFDGVGMSAGIKLKVKLSKGGFYGVWPSGSKFQARVYTPDKHCWDGIGNFDTSLEAAVVTAIAQKSIEMGIKVGSPDKPRVRMQCDSLKPLAAATTTRATRAHLLHCHGCGRPLL